MYKEITKEDAVLRALKGEKVAMITEASKELRDAYSKDMRKEHGAPYQTSPIDFWEPLPALMITDLTAEMSKIGLNVGYNRYLVDEEKKDEPSTTQGRGPTE